MKKLLFTSVLSLAVAGSALAQGIVTWSAFSGNFIGQTNSTQYSGLSAALGGGQSTGSGAAGNTAVTGGQFYYALLYTSFTGAQAAAPTTLAALDAWQQTGLVGTNSTVAGRLVAGPNGGGTGSTVPWANGTTNSIMVVGWSVNLGTSWLSVSNVLNNWAAMGSSIVGNAFFGVSATGYVNPLLGNPGPTIIGATANASGLPINSGAANPAQLFLLQAVPEPGTMALAALGGAAMLMFRRKK